MVSRLTQDAKRTIPVSLRVSEDDLQLFSKAADTLWPGAPLKRAAVVLALARMGAEKALKPNKPKGKR